MTAKQLKNKLSKKTPLLMSPFGFALAACGGGGEAPLEQKLTPVKFLAPTGDDLIDMTTSGSYYRTSETAPIFYGLSHGHYGEQWNNPEEVAKVLQQVMGEFTKYSDIDLKYAGIYDSPNAASEAGVSVVLSFDKFVFAANGDDDAWQTWYPHATENDFGVEQIGGDAYLNYNSTIWQANSQAEFEAILINNPVAEAILLHAMALSIGLKNTKSSTSERPAISTTKFAETFAADPNDYTYSVSHIPYDSLSDDVGSTLGAYDIMGLIYLYGHAKDVNTGDSLYDLSNVREYTVISDSAGVDTVTFAYTDRDVFIVLPNAEVTDKDYSDLVDISFGGGSINYNTPLEVVIGMVGNIENLTTGSGDDLLVGNELDNIIIAGAGDDNILLSAGSDVIYGGRGADTFLAHTTVDGVLFLGTNTLIKDFEIGIDTLRVSDGYEELIYSRNEDGFATYTSSAGVNVVLEGIEANVLLIA